MWLDCLPLNKCKCFLVPLMLNFWNARRINWNHTLIPCGTHAPMWHLILCRNKDRIFKKGHLGVGYGVNFLGKYRLVATFFLFLFLFSLSGYVQENEEKSSLWSKISEVDNRLSDSQVSLYRPRQVKKLGHDELENFVDIYVVCGTWEEKGCFHCLCICPRLHNVVTFLALQIENIIKNWTFFLSNVSGIWTSDTGK